MGNVGRTPIILRLDLEQRTYRWRRSFNCVSCKVEMATSIAVNPAGTLVAIYAVEFKNFDYERDSYILLVDAVSGHYVIDFLWIDHDQQEGTFVAEASGIFFDNYGIVYFAQSHHHGDYCDSDDGSIGNYAPRFSIAAYNTNTKAMEFDWFESTYFGEAMAIAYADYGPGGSNVFVGGSIDNCRVPGNGDKCWMLAINRIKPTGLNESQRQIKF